jgi:hypothetical protein
MKKLLFVVVLFSFSSILLAQKIKIPKNELKRQLDSILNEGNLLYKYEKSAWIATDLVLENPIVKAEFNYCFTYEEQETIKTIILDKELNCIAEYIFEKQFDKPEFIKIEKRELSNKEKILIDIRKTIIENIISEYGNEVGAPDDYNLNLILLPFADKYKLYITTGTVEPNVIPFGNDYIFIADKNGEIENWHKFHSILIPSYTVLGEYKVTRLGHTHLKSTPLITATDICTFMLYAPLYEIDVFSVYSPAIKKTMKYSLTKNKITVK